MAVEALVGKVARVAIQVVIQLAEAIKVAEWVFLCFLSNSVDLR